MTMALAVGDYNPDWFAESPTFFSLKATSYHHRSSQMTSVKPIEIDILDALFQETWLKPTLARISELLALSENWDSQGASKIHFDTGYFVMALLTSLLPKEAPTPQILPLAYGGLQVEWHQNEMDIELEVVRPYEAYLTFFDHQTGEEGDETIATDISALQPVLSKLIERHNLSRHY